MRNLAFTALLCALGLLAACGQKGPLVLPDAQKHKPTTANPAIPLTATPPATPPAAAQAPAQAPAQVPALAPAPAAGAAAQSKDDKPSDAASQL
jgi:predicted small lipoprotein YifL